MFETYKYMRNTCSLSLPERNGLGLYSEEAEGEAVDPREVES